MSDLLLKIIIIWIAYILAGRGVGRLWQSATPNDLDSEDVRAIRILWPVFALIGGSLLLVYAAEDLYQRLGWLPDNRLDVSTILQQVEEE